MTDGRERDREKRGIGRIGKRVEFRRGRGRKRIRVMGIKGRITRRISEVTREEYLGRCRREFGREKKKESMEVALENLKIEKNAKGKNSLQLRRLRSGNIKLKIKKKRLIFNNKRNEN